MPSDIVFRAALPADAYALAELSILGGDGIYEFLLEEMAPREMLAGLMARSIKQNAGSFCWRNYLVAEDQGVVGMVHAFPGSLLQQEERDVLPQDRVGILDPIDQAQDWASFLINSVAVRPRHRRQGIAARLMEMAMDQAKPGGFARATANVWEDNIAARALCEKLGFGVGNRVELPPHPGLGHAGGSLVMVRQLDLP
jgi:ribosomal protein S18 acetylase RimI-like enzyme